MRQLRLLASILLMVCGMNVNVNAALLAAGALGTPGTFGQNANIGAIVSSFLPVEDMKNCALVSRGWANGARVELRLLKAWKEGGGLVVTLFGNPTKEDMGNYYRLNGVPTIPRQMSADQIKYLLLSFVYIKDSGLRDQLSETIESIIQRQEQLQDGARLRLCELLPNATTFELSQWLSLPNYDDEYCPGRSIELDDRDRQKVFLRIITMPRDVANRPNEIPEVLSYMMKTLSSRNARAYFQECLACKALSLLDLSLINSYGLLLGAWEECECAMDRMIGHAETPELLRVYMIVLCRPYQRAIFTPAMQYSTTLPWLFKKAWGMVKRTVGGE